MCSFKPDEGVCGRPVVSVSDPYLALPVEPPTTSQGLTRLFDAKNKVARYIVILDFMDIYFSDVSV